MKYSAAPYNAYSLLAVEDVYNFSNGATANNQQTINPKERKVGSRRCKGLHNFMFTYKYLLQPQVLRGSDATPTQPVINPISISAQR